MNLLRFIRLLRLLRWNWENQGWGSSLFFTQ